MEKISTFYDCQKLLAGKASDVVAVGNTVYHGLGLVEIMPAAKIICTDDDNLNREVQTEGIEVFSLEQRLGKQNIIFRNTAKLLSQVEVISYLKNNSQRPQLYIAKLSTRLEKMAAKYGWDLLSSSPDLNQQFENKIQFTQLLEQNSITKSSREIIAISKENLAAAVKKYKLPLVVQFSRGLAGAGTYFLNDADEINKFVTEFAEREAVVAKKLAGKTITLNACVIEAGVVVGAPFLQISGIPSLNSNRGGTCGNDYGVNLDIDENKRTQIFDQTLTMGEIMRRRGYRGLFGLDFIVGEEVAMIEINARPPASIPTFTQLEHDNGEIPLLGLHLLDFLGIPFDIDINAVNKEKFTAEHKGSKIIFRNTHHQSVIVNKEYTAGVYKVSDVGDMHYLRKGISSIALQNNKEALFWSVKPGKKVNPNIEMATLILPIPATASDGTLSSEVMGIINNLKDKL